MGDRGKDMGDMRAIRAKMAAKYDNEVEAQVRGWMQEMTGDDIGEGPFNVMRNLKSGQSLLKLMNEIFSRTANKPEACQGIDIKAHTMNVEFKHMENINKFLKAAEAYGVPRGSLFQTPDLYEGRNMAQVMSTIVMLGTETRRNNMDGPKIGPNPNQSNYRSFTQEQLAQSKGIISLQAGTNKCASQKGMVMGGVRHISDIKVTDLEREAFSDEAPATNQGYVNDQGGWNEEETQAEVSFQAESAPPAEEESFQAEDVSFQESAPPAEEGEYVVQDEDQGWVQQDEGQEVTYDGDDSAVVGGVTAWTDDAQDDNQEESSATINLSM